MSDEHQSEQQSEHNPSPDERLEEVGTNRGTYDLPEPGEGQRESGTAGLPDEDDVPEETLEDIQGDRKERLDPDNRPDGAEIDNTPRTFDSGAGMFTDNPDYDPDDRPYAGPGDSGPPQKRSDEDQAADEEEPVTSGDD